MNALQRAAIDLIARKQPGAMDAWALERVRGMGLTVVDGSAAVLLRREMPQLLTTWVPTRTKAEPRTVIGGNGWTRVVLYALPSCRAAECDLVTWHRWVRRTRAVCVWPPETHANPTRAACGAVNGSGRHVGSGRGGSGLCGADLSDGEGG